MPLKRWAFWKGFERPEFLIAAHYFSDGWPLDSLQVMRRSAVRRELALLRKDGFNTIIVVVPWRSFQSSQSPISYDPFYEAQLRLVLYESQRAGLAVLLRVAYTHQVMQKPTLNGFRWAQAFLTDAAIERAWLDYFSRIAGIAQDYPCCVGGFVSWEELWHAFRVWQEQVGDANAAAARASGYLDYLQEQGIDHQGCIPSKNSPEHAHYLAFANARMTDMFERARSHWSQLGVEYRVDKDPVPTADGIDWRDNNAFLDWEPHRFSYWAPFMGAENVGEELDARQAEVLLRYMLESTSQGGQFPRQVVEQFNFIDNTQKYLGTHAHIAEDQVDEFLQLAAPLLKQYSGGYGLWASRDYRMNVLYNAAFLAGGRGWTSGKNARFRMSGGLRIKRQGRVIQRIEPRITWVQRNHSTKELVLEVEFLRWRGLGPAELRVRLNDCAWLNCQILAKGKLGVRVPVDLKDVFDNGIHFEIDNQGRPLTITRVFLYYETYAAGVRDLDAMPDRYQETIRRFNETLEERSSVTLYSRARSYLLKLRDSIYNIFGHEISPNE